MSEKRFLPKKVIEISRKKLKQDNMEEEIGEQKKANFSATNGTIKVSNQNSSKGEIKKIIIKNFKCKM